MLRSQAQGPVRAAAIGAKIVAALATLPGLGVGTLWDNSETAYGEVAREILLTHNWVVMHLNNVPYFIQPPLYFWFGAIFSLVMGPTPFALRLPSALATIALAALTGYVVARQAGTRVGVYAAVILSTCLMQAVIGRLAIMDALLDLAVAMTIFFWFRGLETGRDRYSIYGWIAAGGGFLAKGLVAPVVALLVIVPYYLWNRRYEPAHPPSARAWIVGVLAFLAIVAPWPIALVAHDRLFPLEKLIGEYTVGRYTGVVENQSGPLWYYVPVIILGFFPWIAFLPMAIVYGVNQLRANVAQDRQLARLVRLGFAWTVMPLLFFSFARTKLPNYVALELPALALITALYFEAVVRKGGTRSAVVSAATVPVTIGALAFAIWLFTRNNRLTSEVTVVVAPLLGMAVAIFAGSLLTALLVARSKSVAAAPYALALAAVIGADVLAVTGLAARRSVQAGAATRDDDRARTSTGRRRRDSRSLRRQRAPVLHAARRARARAAQRRRSSERRPGSARGHLRRAARLGGRAGDPSGVRSDVRAKSSPHRGGPGKRRYSYTKDGAASRQRSDS